MHPNSSLTKWYPWSKSPLWARDLPSPLDDSGCEDSACSKLNSSSFLLTRFPSTVPYVPESDRPAPCSSNQKFSSPSPSPSLSNPDALTSQASLLFDCFLLSLIQASATSHLDLLQVLLSPTGSLWLLLNPFHFIGGILVLWVSKLKSGMCKGSPFLWA